MKIEMTNEWFGRVLNHPTNVCSLAWGITWRALVSVIGAAVALGFLSVWTYANYRLVGVMLFGAEAHASIGFGLVFDVVIIAGLYIFSEDWVPTVKPYLDPITKKVKNWCPQVEWKNETDKQDT